MIKIDATAAKAHASTKPLTWTHVVGTQPNMCLVVGVGPFGDGGGTSVSGITAGGVAMTKATGGTTGERNGMLWYLFNPPKGSITVSVTWTGDDCMGGSVSFYTTKQEAPVTATKTGSSATANVDITTAHVASLLVGLTFMETNSTITSSDSLIATDAWKGTYEYGCNIAYKLNQTGASTMNWTNENKSWTSYAISFKPIWGKVQIL